MFRPLRRSDPEPTRALPPIDASVPAGLQTATFAVG